MGHSLRGSRPIHKWDPLIQWQAREGVRPVGPPRPFQWQAVKDLPPSAGVEMSDGAYECDLRFGVSPVHACIEAVRPFDASDFAPGGLVW